MGGEHRRPSFGAQASIYDPEQDLEARCVHPLEVVEHEDAALGPERALDGVSDRLEEANARASGRDPELLVSEELRRDPRELCLGPRRQRQAPIARELAHEACDRREGNLGIAGPPLGPQHPPTRRGELAEQPRFSDPRLTLDDREDTRRARPLELGPLSGSADPRWVKDARRQGLLTRDPWTVRPRLLDGAQQLLHRGAGLDGELLRERLATRLVRGHRGGGVASLEVQPGEAEMRGLGERVDREPASRPVRGRREVALSLAARELCVGRLHPGSAHAPPRPGEPHLEICAAVEIDAAEQLAFEPSRLGELSRVDERQQLSHVDLRANELDRRVSCDEVRACGLLEPPHDLREVVAPRRLTRLGPQEPRQPRAAGRALEGEVGEERRGLLLQARDLARAGEAGPP